MKEKSKLTTYKEDLFKRYWEYQKLFFPVVAEWFERPFEPNGRPPVFIKDRAEGNIITRSEGDMGNLLDLLPKRTHHKLFCSMNSSQALALSILGNLVINKKLGCLAAIVDDDGAPLLGRCCVARENFVMEHKIGYLGEPRPTSLDGFISGPYQVAIECKFTEQEFGACSRPLLTEAKPNYCEYCDGNFTRQLGRKERCSLSEIGVQYWKYVPQLFGWKADCDLVPCPLHKNYQLVRNVLAACVRPDGTVSPENGHVVVIYDDRNPAFQEGGKGFLAFGETKKALKVSGLLRKCSWQRIVRRLNEDTDLHWLTEQLGLKYGLK